MYYIVLLLLIVLYVPYIIVSLTTYHTFCL